MVVTSPPERIISQACGAGCSPRAAPAWAPGPCWLPTFAANALSVSVPLAGHPLPRRASAAVADAITAFVAAVDSSSSPSVKLRAASVLFRAVPAGELGRGACRSDRGVLLISAFGAMSVPVPVGLDRDGLGEGAVGERSGLAEHAARGGRGYAVRVLGAGPGHQRGYLLGLEHRPPVLSDRLVHPDELAGRPLPDDAPLVAVQQLRLVLTLQAQADTFRDEEGDYRTDDDQHPRDPGDRVQRDLQEVGDDVVGTLDPQDTVEHHGGDPDAGPHRGVPWPVVNVVVRLVPGGPPFEERPECGPA